MRSSFTVLALVGAILFASAGEASAQRGGGGRGGSGGGRSGGGWGGSSRQGGYGNNYYGGGYGGFGGFGGYTPYYQDSGMMYGFAPYGYAPNYLTPEPYNYSTQSFYNAAQTSPMTQADHAPRQTMIQLPTSQQAAINVTLPTAETELWFGSSQVAQQAGTTRLVYSPDLEAGKTYTYKITARWMVDGKQVEKIHEVDVRAGQTSMTDFRKAG